jgi:hemoglobin/transferrin/lactoferrin receptor protein
MNPCPHPHQLAALRPHYLSLCLALMGLHSGAQAQAQAQAQSAVAGQAHATLPTVVISGARFELANDDLPLSADIVSEGALRDQQSRNLRQALQDLPNTEVRSSPARLAVGASSNAFARDGNMGIQIRGLGGNRVLMTVDGIRMPRSYVSRSAMFDREYLSLETFKRIELIRGPASAQYGGDGMAGVINFVSHEPSDFLRHADGSAKAVGGRVALGWNEEDHGTTVTGTVAAQASEQVQWMLTASGRQAHEVSTMGDNDAPNHTRTQANPQDQRDAALLGKLVWRPSAQQRHVFTLEHAQKKQDANLLSSRGPDERGVNDIRDEFTHGSVERSRFAWDGRFGLGTAWADHLRTVVSVQRATSERVGHSWVGRVANPSLPPTHRIRDNRFEETTWQLGLQADKVLRAGAGAGAMSHRLVYGLDYVHSSISNLYTGQHPLPPETFPLKRFPDTHETSVGLYVQDETVLGDWTITPGLRIDHFRIDVQNQHLYHPPAAQPARDMSGTAVLPKLGVLYRVTPQWSVFGQYASGYRAPEAGQLNDRFQLDIGPNQYSIIPNPHLQPERSRGVELGLRGRLERLSLDVVGFYNRYSNLIEDARLMGTQGSAMRHVFQTVNVPRAKIYGFEVKGIYDWGTVADGRLRTSFSYGHSRGRDTSTDVALNAIAPAQLSLGVRYDRAQWGVYADARHHWAKQEQDIDLLAIGNHKAGTTQFATPAATTLDLGGQWRPRKQVRVNLALHNVTNRKYWMWADVYGQAASSSTIDAYSQPGRHLRVSMVMDF